jgi:predicted nucleic acid-binding protein
MKVIADTSVIVGIERKDNPTQRAMKIIAQNCELYLSTITIAEILTGTYLRQDFDRATAKAKRLMGQFQWQDLTPPIAEQVGEANAYLISTWQQIELPDVIIGATCVCVPCEYLLTHNQRHFERMEFLRGKVMTPADLVAKMADEWQINTPDSTEDGND